MEFDLVKGNNSWNHRPHVTPQTLSLAARHSTNTNHTCGYIKHIRHLHFTKTTTMSAYYNIPVETSIVVCSECKTATFGWLAAVFTCHECEGTVFIPAEDEEADGEEADPDISMEDNSDAADIAKREQAGEKANE